MARDGPTPKGAVVLSHRLKAALGSRHGRRLLQCRFDLLADALATAGGKDYPALLHNRITGRLGMLDTGVAPTREQCEQLMTGSGSAGRGLAPTPPRPRAAEASIRLATTW